MVTNEKKITKTQRLQILITIYSKKKERKNLFFQLRKTKRSAFFLTKNFEEIFQAKYRGYKYERLKNDPYDSAFEARLFSIPADFRRTCDTKVSTHVLFPHSFRDFYPLSLLMYLVFASSFLLFENLVRFDSLLLLLHQII